VGRTQARGQVRGVAEKVTAWVPSWSAVGVRVTTPVPACRIARPAGPEETI
jgi:hypothetical protein